jgi:hypothetical protein
MATRMIDRAEIGKDEDWIGNSAYRSHALCVTAYLSSAVCSTGMAEIARSAANQKVALSEAKTRVERPRLSGLQLRTLVVKVLRSAFLSSHHLRCTCSAPHNGN